MKNSPFVAAALGLAAVAFAGEADARDRLHMVGSSTVYPFATAVAEEFGKTSGFKTPVVESTGSGGGIKLFCAGIGINHPDIANSSRRIKKSEVETCTENGVTAITEVKIGYDGIVIANARSAPPFALTLRQLFLALAKDVPQGGAMVPNPYRKWSELDSAFPAVKIEVLGPPPTSGTRDAFAELALEGGCKTFDAIKALKMKDEAKYKAVCHSVREDGVYIEAGENDNLIVQKLKANPDALGVFGYSFLEQNSDKVQASTINQVAATFDAIADGEYPIARSLYFYVKGAHVGMVPGIAEYVEEFTSDRAAGEFGYLIDKGLIPLPDADREGVREDALSFAPLGM